MELKQLLHQIHTALMKLREFLRIYARSILVTLFLVTSLLLMALVSVIAWTYFNSIAPPTNTRNTPLMEAQNAFLEVQVPRDGNDEKSSKAHFQEIHGPMFVDSKSSELNFDELVNTNVVNSDLMHDGGFDNDEQDTGEMMSPGEYRDSSFDEERNVNNKVDYNIPKTATVKNKIETKDKLDTVGESSEETLEMQPMTLYKVDKGIRDGAVCLDGSPPAYYHRPGVGPNDRSWIIHFNGGAWCFDKKACIERSRSSLGSTKKLPKSPPIIQGINSPNPAINPDFYDWNLVWIVYCDGASFTGNLERPIISSGGDTIYMRGKRVIDAIINDLLFKLNFKNAESIVLTGSSAGSMAAIFQADYIASKFPENVPIKVLADAGYFVDTQPIGGKSLTNMFRKVFEMQNASGGMNQECVHRFAREPWKCFLPAVATHFVKTPIYYLNSAYDIWSLIYFLGIDCKFPTIDEQGRKKRSVSGRNVLGKSDSDLNLYTGTSLESVNEILRHKRDISGFEMRPFFRDYVNKIQNTVRKVVAGVMSAKLSNKIVANRTFDVDGRRSEISNAINLHQQNETSTNNTRPNIYSVTNKTHERNNVTREAIGDVLKGPFLNNNTSIVIITSNTSNIKHFKKPNTTERFKKNKIVKPNNALFIGKLKILNSLLPKQIISSLSDEKNSELQQNLHSSFHKVLSSDTHSSHKYLKPSSTKYSKQLQNMRVKSTKTKGNGTAANTKISSTSKLHSIPIIDYSLKAHDNTDSISLQTTQKASKRHSLKRRRSASIAREYINILRSDPPECTEQEMKNALKYRNLILRDMDQSMKPQSSGRFLVSCIDHSMSLFDETWTDMKIGGKSIQQAFGEWFFNRVSRDKSDLIDCPYPCNESCP